MKAWWMKAWWMKHAEGTGTMDISLAQLWPRPHEDDDVAVVRARAKAMEDEAFSEIVRRQASLLYRVAFALLRDPHEAEDAVQETFLKLYRTGRWRYIQQERAFLARAVWRNALDRLPRSGIHMEDVEASDPADTRESPEESSLRTSEQALLHRLIDGLPEDLRQPLLLCAIDEMNSREVAAALSLPEGTVRTRVMRAKAELRRRFEATKGARP